MTHPKTYHAWRRTKAPYPLSIVRTTESLPDKLGPHDILIRIHAVSLNYRDVAMLREGAYPIPVEEGGITASDCAAEVVATGDQVKQFREGDRVAPTPDLENLTGDERDINGVTLGGDGPGMLREYAIFEENQLVKLPNHLSWEEASTITVAGITTWTALNRLQGLTSDATAILQGTGGVSMFALLVCLAAGIKPIITSSSDTKIEKLKQLYPAVSGINYKTSPNIVADAFDLSGGKGIDYVLNNVGVSSIPTDLQMLRKRGGRIALVGFLGGFTGDWSPSALMTLIQKEAHIQGILGGSRADFEALNRFLESKSVRLNSLIDRVYAFDEAEAAFEYLAAGKHTGKVVIRL